IAQTMAGMIPRFIAGAPVSRAALRHGRQHTIVGALNANAVEAQTSGGTRPGRAARPSPARGCASFMPPAIAFCSDPLQQSAGVNATQEAASCPSLRRLLAQCYSAETS